MRILLVFLLLVAFSSTTPSSAQRFAVAARVSYTMADMVDLKGFQNGVRQQLMQDGIPGQILDPFPDFYAAQVQLTYQIFRGSKVWKRVFREAMAGVTAEYGSTGGRIYYGDQVGEAQIDHLVEYYAVGGVYEQAILGTQRVGSLRLMPLMTIHTTYFRTEMRTEEKLDTGEVTTIRNHHSSADHVGFEVGPALQFSLNVFLVRFGATYRFALPVILELTGEDRPFYLGNTTEGPRVDWSGPRLGVTVGIDLSLRKSR